MIRFGMRLTSPVPLSVSKQNKSISDRIDRN